MILFFFHDSFDLNQISSPLSRSKYYHTITNAPPYVTVGSMQSSFSISPSFLLTLTSNYQKSSNLFSSVHNTFYYILMYTFFVFLPITVFSAYSLFITRHSQSQWTSQFFTAQYDTGFCQEELSLGVDSGEVFLLCCLLSIIKCLFSAAVGISFALQLFFC